MISQIVTCEEHIKALKRAQSIISTAYTLDCPKELSLAKNRITMDISTCITHYEDWLEKNSDVP